MNKSFDEAVHEYAKEHKVALDVASLAVADEYEAAVTDRRSEVQFTARVDRRILDDGLYYHPRPVAEGQPIRLDSVPSPAWVIQRAKTVAAAKARGDEYRFLSRITSMHLAGDL